MKVLMAMVTNWRIWSGLKGYESGARLQMVIHWSSRFRPLCRAFGSPKLCVSPHRVGVSGTRCPAFAKATAGRQVSGKSPWRMIVLVLVLVLEYAWRAVVAQGWNP